MDEIKDLSRKTDLNNLIYFFKSKNSSLITFVGSKAPFHFIKKYLMVIQNYQKQRKIKNNLSRL